MLKNKLKIVALSVLAATSISFVANNNVHAAESAVTISAVKSAEVEEGFKDMTNSHWAYDSVLWAQADGMISGYPDGTFKPNKQVSEAEFLAMLVRVMEVNKEVTPASDGDWSEPYYVKAKALNYPVTGKRNESITRTKVAELVSSSQGVNYSGNNAIIFMLGNKLANGKTSATVEGYKGSDLLTRAEAVQFLRNVIDMVDIVGLMERPVQPSNPADLPKLPEVKPVENTNAKLEALRKQVEEAMAKDGYKVTASSHEFSITVKDGANKSVAKYADYRGTGGVRVINVWKPIRVTDLKVDMDRINAAIKMIQAAGNDIDDKLADDMVEVLTTPTKEKSIQNGGYKIWLTRDCSELLMTIE